MRVFSPIVAPGSTTAVGWIVTPTTSILQRQCHSPTVPCRKVGGDEHLERPQTFTAVRLRFSFPAKGANHVVIVKRMSEAVHRGRHVARILDALVICSRFGELPVLDLVYGNAPDAHSAVLPEYGD